MVDSHDAGSRLLSIVVAACAVGCFSRPLLPELSADQIVRLDNASPAAWAAHLDCVPPASEDRLACERAVAEVASLLAPSKLFRTLQATPQDATLEITIHPSIRHQYYTKPGHNPGFVLLSIVIPFWWSERYGYHFTARAIATGQTVEVSTIREGTNLMWGFAPIVNLSPNRALVDHPERERQQIESELLVLLPSR